MSATGGGENLHQAQRSYLTTRYEIETLHPHRAKDLRGFLILGVLSGSQATRRPQTSRPSSRSVTSAAIGLRSLRVKVTWANNGWPLSASMTAATPS